jgi:hypothetical protein
MVGESAYDRIGVRAEHFVSMGVKNGFCRRLKIFNVRSPEYPGDQNVSGAHGAHGLIGMPAARATVLMRGGPRGQADEQQRRGRKRETDRDIWCKTGIRSRRTRSGQESCDITATASRGEAGCTATAASGEDGFTATAASGEERTAARSKE